jgi:hypothetical protein
MEVNFNVPLLSLDDKPIINEDKTEVNVRSLVVNAICGVYKNEENLPGEEKIIRWNLATKIHKAADSVTVTVEEIVLIKKLVSQMYGVNVVGPVWTMLEG